MVRSATVTARRSGRDLGDVAVGDGHGPPLGPQPRTVAGRAGHLAHVGLDPLTDAVGLGLAVAAVEVGHHALVGGVVGALPPVAVLVAHVDRLAGAEQDHLALLVGQLAPGGAQGEAVALGDGIQQPVDFFFNDTAPMEIYTLSLHDANDLL